METLKTHFRMKNLHYTLLKRNAVVAMYGIGITYTGELFHWEVCKIYIRKDKYGIKESVHTNEKFGRDHIRCFMNEKLALEYYDKLTSDLLQGVVKSIAGVDQSTKAIEENKPEVNTSSCHN